MGDGREATDGTLDARRAVPRVRSVAPRAADARLRRSRASLRAIDRGRVARFLLDRFDVTREAARVHQGRVTYE